MLDNGKENFHASGNDVQDYGATVKT